MWVIRSFVLTKRGEVVAGIYFSDETLTKIRAYKSGNFAGHPEWAAGTEWNASGRNWTQYTGAWANTNWFDEMYNTNVPSTEHTLSVNGGTGKINYYLSGAYLGQKGLISFGEDVFKRYNFTGKISAAITDWLRAEYTQRWVREDYTRPSYMTGLFFHNIARRWPTNAVRDTNGNLVFGNETIQMERGGINDNQTDRVNHQLNFVIKPFEDLSIHLESAYNTTYYNNHQSILPTYGHDINGAPYFANRDDDTAGNITRVTEIATKNMYFNGRYYAQWGHIFGKKHDVRVNVGMDIEENRYRNLGGNKRDLITPSIATINTATNATPVLEGGYSHWSTMGVFGRVNYVYDDRYLIEATLRHNGSSRFIGDKTWGTFPALSLGWNIANEAFFSPLKSKVNVLKLRASWGALGNTNTNSLYPWFLALPVTAGGITQGTAWMVNGQRLMASNAPGLVSSSLTWERVESWNFGLDWAALNNRFQGSLDVYSRSTKDMVGPASPVSSILGASLPPQNNSDLRSYGWELELRWRDQIGDLRYGAKFVLADSQVEITKFYNPTGTFDTWIEGRKMGEIWGYKTAGLAKSDAEMTAHLANNRPTWGNNWAAGDLMYLDLNGDKEVSAKSRTINDHGDLTVIGNNRPRYTYSLNLDAAYKGFDFSILLQGVMKKDFWDNSPYSIGANHGMWQSAAFNDHWDFFRPEGDPLGANLDSYFPRPLFEAGGKNFQVNDRYIQSAAYMRIKNIQLGYTLPQSLVTRVGLNSVRVYASADNLVTFTKMNKIFDPEATGGSWGSGKIYPLQRTISFGLNVNL